MRVQLSSAALLLALWLSTFACTSKAQHEAGDSTGATTSGMLTTTDRLRRVQAKTKKETSKPTTPKRTGTPTTSQPTGTPTTSQPTVSNKPTVAVTPQPSKKKSGKAKKTSSPTNVPSFRPTSSPSSAPSSAPSSCSGGGPCCSGTICEGNVCICVGPGFECDAERPCCGGLICDNQFLCAPPCIAVEGDCSGGGTCCSGSTCVVGLCTITADAGALFKDRV